MNNLPDNFNDFDPETQQRILDSLRLIEKEKTKRALLLSLSEAERKAYILNIDQNENESGFFIM